MTAIIHVVGNLTRDPETKDFGNSSATKLSVASNRVVKGQKSVTYYNATVWGNFGKSAEQHFSKGDTIYVWGEHVAREYQAGTGETRTSEDIENASWAFAGGKSSSSTGGKQSQQDDYDDSDEPF